MFRTASAYAVVTALATAAALLLVTMPVKVSGAPLPNETLVAVTPAAGA